MNQSAASRNLIVLTATDLGMAEHTNGNFVSDDVIFVRWFS